MSYSHTHYHTCSKDNCNGTTLSIVLLHYYWPPTKLFSLYSGTPPHNYDGSPHKIYIKTFKACRTPFLSERSFASDNSQECSPNSSAACRRLLDVRHGVLVSTPRWRRTILKAWRASGLQGLTLDGLKNGPLNPANPHSPHFFFLLSFFLKF